MTTTTQPQLPRTFKNQKTTMQINNILAIDTACNYDILIPQLLHKDDITMLTLKYANDVSPLLNIIHKTAITSITFGRESLCPESAETLVKVLKQNEKINDVSFAEGCFLNIDRAHIDEIVAALRDSRLITRFGLFGGLFDYFTDAFLRNDSFTFLEIYQAGINMEVLSEMVKVHRKIEILCMNDAYLGDDDIVMLVDGLKENVQFKEIDLLYNNISAVGCKVIADWLRKQDRLTSLVLSCNRVGEGIKYFGDVLAHTKNLVDLQLDSCFIENEGMDVFANGLAKNTTMDILNLQGNAFNHIGLGYIADALKVNHTITELVLQENEIGDKGIAKLVDALKVNTTIQVLNLMDTGIGDTSAGYIGALLETNTTINSIGLEHNHITTAGIKQLAKGLKQNETLKNLLLSGNAIADEGCRFIGNVLRYNSSITELGLSSVDMEDEGLYHIVDAIKYNTVITSIHLQGNNFTHDGFKALASSLKENISITSVIIGYEEFTQLRYFVDVLKECINLEVLDASGFGQADIQLVDDLKAAVLLNPNIKFIDVGLPEDILI